MESDELSRCFMSNIVPVYTNIEDQRGKRVMDKEDSVPSRLEMDF